MSVRTVQKQQNSGREALSLLAYVLEDWMKRSYCLLQVLDYMESVKKTSGVCYKSLKSCSRRYCFLQKTLPRRLDKTKTGAYNERQKGRRDKRLVLSANQEMTAILDRGRSFPFAEDLVTDSDNASNHNHELKQIAICNHGISPFPGKRLPL